MSEPTNPLTARLEAEWTYWPILLAAVLVALLAPWYFGLLSFDLHSVLWAMFGISASVALLAQWPVTTDLPHAFLHATPYLIGTAALCWAWYLVGGFHAPAFLFLLMIPVVGAAFASKGWLEYAVAGVGIVGASAAGLAGSPALRWYVERFVPIPEWAVALGAVPMFGSSAYADAREQALTLTQLAVGLIAAALMVNAVSRVLDRLVSNAVTLGAAKREADELVAQLLRSSDSIEALVATDGGVVVSATAAFRAEMAVDDETDRKLTELLCPVRPERLQSLLEADERAELTALQCRIGGEHRLLDIAAEPLTHDGEQLRALRITATAAGTAAAAALEEVGFALLVLGPGERVLSCNRAFAEVFGDAAVGQVADIALRRDGLAPAWWRIAPRQRAALSFDCDGRAYSATLLASGRDADTALTVIHLEREADNDA